MALVYLFNTAVRDQKNVFKLRIELIATSCKYELKGDNYRKKDI